MPHLWALISCFFPALAAPTDWPHPRGPQLDGKISAPGIFEDAESIGLELTWKAALGPGYSGIAVAGGLAVTAFSDGDGNWVVAFDAGTGREVWRRRLGEFFAGRAGSTEGPLSSPVIEEGRVYALDPRGDLLALRLEDGTEVWKRTLRTDLGAREPDFGFGSTPLAAGGVIVVQIGGEKGQAIVGLDAETGETRWTLGDDQVEYQSPSVMTLAGRTQVVAAGVRELVGLDADSGERLWTNRLEGEEKTFAANPTFIDEDRFVLFFGNHLTAYRLSLAGDSYRLDELYRSTALGSTYAAPVYHDGYLYGFRGNILTCVEAATGQRMWRSRSPGGNGLILVDGRLVIFATGGHVVVADASPEGYRERARLQALGRNSLTWPSFVGSTVFVRNLEEIAAVTIGRRPASEAPVTAEAPAADHFMTRWVERIESAEDPSAVVGELVAGHPRWPIVDGEYVHFLYQGDAEDVALAGSMVGSEKLLAMDRIAGTDLFYRSLKLEPDCRWEYRFQVDYEWWVADPKNPRRVPIPGEEATASEVTTGRYATALHLADPGDASGRVEILKLASSILEETRNVAVWLPPGYDPEDSETAYPLLVVNGGTAWLRKGLLTQTLANLVGERLPPLVAAFVSPAESFWLDTGGDGTDDYVRMLAEELVPALEKRYRLSPERGLMGNQMWALPSLLAALRYPAVFDRVGVQSPAFEMGGGPMVRELLESRAGADTFRVYVDWNRYDYKNGEMSVDLVEEGETLVFLLREAGYRITGGEVLDSYGWSGWRNRSDQLLGSLFAP